MIHNITLIPGDGTGPELVEATRRVLEATGVSFNWDPQEAGANQYALHGSAFPDPTLASLLTTRVALKGPTSTPNGPGFRSVNLQLRRELDLYACIRPCKAFAGTRTRFPELDIVIIRENIEDLYAGIEFERGTEAHSRLRATLEALGASVGDDTGIGIKPISIRGSERIVRTAFEYARTHDRRKVTAAHKANLLKWTDGVFLETARAVAQDYPDIAFDDRLIDNLCNQLVSRPEQYDVIVTPNQYGDILSDLGAGMIGGLGLAGGANIGPRAAVFEAAHGSAPKYAGRNMANPTALILSGVYMLNHLGEHEAARRIERALAEIIRTGDRVTFDLKPTRDDPGAVGTSEFADALIQAIRTGMTHDKQGACL